MKFVQNEYENLAKEIISKLEILLERKIKEEELSLIANKISPSF